MLQNVWQKVLPVRSGVGVEEYRKMRRKQGKGGEESPWSWRIWCTVFRSEEQQKEPHDRCRHEVLCTIDTIDWTERVQDGSLRTLEDARVWMGSTIVPIHFPVSSNIQFPVFYHFPFLSTSLPYQRAKNGCFSPVFHVLLICWKWIKSRKNDGMNNPGKVNEKERKNQRKQRKDIEKYETKQGIIWELLTLQDLLFGVPKIDS